jgi:RNase adaptor protein for sRNA GlmZ degradation
MNLKNLLFFLLSIMIFSYEIKTKDKSEKISVSAPIHSIKKNINAALNSAYIRAYSEKNLFTKPLSKEGLIAWNKILKELQEIVKAKSYSNSAIDKAITSLVDLSNTIENIIKSAKNTGAVKKSNKKERNQLAELLEDLQSKVKTTRYKIDALKKETFFLHRSSRNEARSLSLNLWEILETIAQKTNKDALVYKAK